MKPIATLLLILALALSPWVISIAYMHAMGASVIGKVVAKREAFDLPGGDSWKHVFEVKYQYRPLDSRFPETAVQRVNEGFYRGLQVGSPVQVRYSPSRFVRSFAGMGLYLEGASALSRLNGGPPDQQSVVAAGALVLALLLGLSAYRLKSKPLGVIAGLVVGSCFPVLLLGTSGFILFPVLFWAWLSNRGKGYGLALLATIALSAAVLYWRVPQKAQMPAGPHRYAAAIVRQVRVVDELWTSYGRGGEDAGGQHIREPFQMVDLEFRPEGAAEPIHTLDQIDLNSVPELRTGATVQVIYSPTNPSIARIAGGTRNYAGRIVFYLMGVSYGIGAVLAFLVFPAIFALDRLFHSFTKALLFRTREESARVLARFPAGDQRRVAIEKAMQALERLQSHRPAPK